MTNQQIGQQAIQNDISDSIQDMIFLASHIEKSQCLISLIKANFKTYKLNEAREIYTLKEEADSQTMAELINIINILLSAINPDEIIKKLKRSMTQMEEVEHGKS